MREDLQMSPGKLAAQAAHASISAYEKADASDVEEWKRSGMTKVVLSVWREEDIIKLYKQAVADYLPTALIADEGRTEVKPGSITALGIGPAAENAINQVTGMLSLYGKEEATGRDFLV
jgi:PTH2 family peptidyl-tRNA hydrolase